MRVCWDGIITALLKHDRTAVGHIIQLYYGNYHMHRDISNDS